jgi:hypothetical protein
LTGSASRLKISGFEKGTFEYSRKIAPNFGNVDIQCLVNSHAFLSIAKRRGLPSKKVGSALYEK